MTTPSPGDYARLFQWYVEHYYVRGGPNDPVAPSNAPPTSGGVLSWSGPAVVPPLPGPLPSNINSGIQQAPRPQMLASTGTFGVNPSNNSGGIYLGTLPQGAWIDSLEIYQYTAFAGGTLNGWGFFYAAAGSFSNLNTPGYQPATVWALATNTSANNAANTLWSTESGANRTAFNSVAGNVGNGQDLPALGTGSLASFEDIDLYLIVFNTGALTAGELAVKIEYTGLVG